METLHQEHELLLPSMLNLNAVVQTTNDVERSGHPKSAVVSENIKQVHKMVLKHRKVKLHEIADTVKISQT